MLRTKAVPSAPGSVEKEPARTELSQHLLRWFDENRRDLPWRRTSDPYAIWVSEIMLQQTRVETVRGYYARWMEALPTVARLASADEAEVLSLWQGLGYYSRARRLLEGARYVVANFGGHLPRSQAELLDVPGIGPYSAGAVASIAFGEPVPAIDGNVVRVLSRLFVIEGPTTSGAHRRSVEQRVREILPRDRPGDFNQALMELGATVCTPTSPACSFCPVRGECGALRTGAVEQLPWRERRAPPTLAEMVVMVLHAEGRVGTVSLGDEARWWRGLRALPTLEVGAATTGAVGGLSLGLGSIAVSVSQPWATAVELFGLKPEAASLLEPVQHSVTRYRLTLRPVVVEVRRGDPRLPSGLHFFSEQELTREPLPAPYRRILRSFFGALAEAPARPRPQERRRSAAATEAPEGPSSKPRKSLGKRGKLS